MRVGIFGLTILHNFYIFGLADEVAEVNVAKGFHNLA